MVFGLIGAIVLTVVAILTLWPYIREILIHHVLPFCRKHLPVFVSKGLTKLTQWLDGKIVSPTRKGIRGLWKNYRKTFLGRKTTYKQLERDKFTSIGENYIQKDDGRVVRQTIEEDILWEDIPEEMRNEFYDGKVEVVTDEMRNTEMKAKERVREDLELSEKEMELLLV